MAKFSKGQYVVLMRALRLARGNVESFPSPGQAIQGWNVAARYIAQALKLDSPSFSEGLFMEIVKGEKPLDSSPWGERLPASTVPE